MNSPDQAINQQWLARGWVRFDNLLPDATVEQLPGWIDAISQAPKTPDEKRLHFYEETDRGPALCRTERYLNDHADIRALVTSGPLADMAASLFGEPAVVYKEKVNYKAPGGAGFAPHQDATAYKFINHHITCLVAVDSMTPENGCLEFARGAFESVLPQNGEGCLTPHSAQALLWDSVPLPRGGVLFFSSLVPHRSAPNHSRRPRRALYLTLNASSEGDRRDDYYETLEHSLRQPALKNARISTIGHFQGRPAAQDGTR